MNEKRKIVIINQAVNYLTIGFCNSFIEYFSCVALITGNVHSQGETLDPRINVSFINKWNEKSNKLKMISYLFATIRIYLLLITKYRRHEVFFVSLPPMAYLLNIFLPNRFSMVIWDIYPDVFKITGMSENSNIYKIWAFLNRISFKKAYKIFTISEVMKDSLCKYVHSDKIIIQPIWSIFQENLKINKTENPFVKENNLKDVFVVQYSGNIGFTHNVEILIELAEILKNDNGILFQIIGRGIRKPILEKLVEKKKLPNCQFLSFQDDDEFIYSLSAADLGVVILDESTSKGSVPSKSYNLMSFGIPSIYFSSYDSQLKIYSDTYKHAKTFTKFQLNEAADFIKELKNNNEVYKLMADNSLKASNDFKRQNAIKFVTKYINNTK
jgi:hypothetical protein